MKRSLTRRNVLRGAAGLSLALPWLESLAQTAAPPRRVVFSFTANGDDTDRRMKVKSETGFVFDDMLSPFEAWRSNLIVLDGLSKYHENLPSDQQADAHEQGGSALAPWPSGAGSFPIGGSNGATIGYVMGPSADYAIGDRVRAANPGVTYRHLVYRVGDNYNNIWNQHAHAGPVGTQAPIPPETSPFTAYTRIFGNLNTADQAALKRRLAMRGSSLDLVKAELTSLRPRLSTSDQVRLDRHTESIREVERGLVSLQNQVQACQPLAMPASFDVYNSDNYKQVGFIFLKMIAMAFACDLTRSVQFNWSGNTNDRVYKTLGLTEGHHSLSHNADDTSFVKIRSVKQHLFDLSCQLHAELKAIPEAGGTVFDNTLVVHWSELSQGDTHSRSNDLVVLATGSNNYFRTGRYLNMLSASKRSFSDMLVSCFHYMGFTDVSSFGYSALSPSGGGPLANLT
jgi:hypothetical protein